MTRKSSSKKLLDNVDKLVAMAEYQDDTMDVDKLYNENIRMLAMLARHGISMDDSSFSDIEIICIKQINQFKCVFDKQRMEKSDAEAFEKLHNILSKEQQKEKTKEKVTEAIHTTEELIAIAKQSKK